MHYAIPAYEEDANFSSLLKPFIGESGEDASNIRPEDGMRRKRGIALPVFLFKQAE